MAVEYEYFRSGVQEMHIENVILQISVFPLKRGTHSFLLESVTLEDCLGMLAHLNHAVRWKCAVARGAFHYILCNF